MSARTSVSTARLVLDDQAVSAFVKEIAASVHNTALACVHDRGGRQLWHRSYQSIALEPGDCAPPSDGSLTEATKRSLGHGNFAFDFPLDCKNVEGCVFTLVVYTLDPPSLTSVRFLIAKILNCIARQIDVDATLNTVSIITSNSSPSSQLSRALEDTPAGDSISTSLQGVVDLCFADGDSECVAAVIPATQTMAIACKKAFEKDALNNLVAQLSEPLEKKRRLIKAQIILSDALERQVLCAPLLRKQQSIDGMVLLITNKVKRKHSKIIRLLANKVGKILQSEPSEHRLFNRFELVARMNQTLQAQTTLPHSLVYFDADKMHTINDAFGYSGGDRALVLFRRILVDSAGANDSVAHLGSDRFAMFLPGASGDTALAKSTQVLQFLTQESIDDDLKSIKLSTSAGVVDTLAASKGAEDMLVLAEVAARGAKDRGGNQCALFQDIDSSIIQRRSDVDKVGFLQMALLENRFELHAQRIEAINAESGQKYELLARLNDGENSDSSPAQFLSAAERYQLMAALDRWVINSALTSISEADSSLEISLATFCINISAQSLQDDSFLEFIESRIAESGIPPDTLCFELTETSLVRHIDRAQRFIHRLQRLGCLVALDDFGTGYSSFAYLKTLPVNFLKIDGSFVRDILESDLSKTIVNAVVSIADVIGAQTVAEHVENPMVQAWLKQAGVHFVQGFVVHRPEPLANVLQQMDGLSGLFVNDSDSIDLRLEADSTVTQTAVIRNL